VRERLVARARGARDERAVPAAPRASARRRLHPALAAGLGGLLAASVAGVLVYDAARRAAAEEQSIVAKEIDAVRAQVAELEQERDQLDSDLADTEARMRVLESDLVLAKKTIGVLHAEHAESLALAGTAHAEGASGRVFWDWDEWYCYMRLAGLAKDPAKTYAIWLFTEDDVIGVGTFHANADGTATFLGPVPHDVGHVLRAGVSIEPDEDLGTKPRGEVVLVGAATARKS
jgi:hypothetical protein